MLTRAIRILLALVVVLAVAAAGAFRWATVQPVARAFPLPAKTTWTPRGPRNASGYTSPVIPAPNAFHTMHVGVNNTDELWSVAAPVVEYAWTAEPTMYVAEGPTYDDQGNLYFSPYNPREDVSLVSLDRETGARRWTKPGRGAGGSAPLILQDPDRPGEQLIYHATYTTAMALRPDGSVVWQVPTGLTLPVRQPGERDYTHAWGVNYLPQADAVLSVTMDGFVVAFDRRTGRALLDHPFHIPGAPAPIVRRPPAWIVAPANRETDAVFGRTIDDLGLFTAITDVIFGNGFQIANFYGVDQNTGRIYVAATAPDDQDGATDGVSQNGALYLLELVAGADGRHEVRQVRYYTFEGGTGSTPTVSPNGDRVVVSDDNGNVIALDAELKELWRTNVGAQVAASIAVACDRREMYAVTQYDVVKLIDHGTSGEIAWRATLDAYPGFDNFNALTPTITANGIAVSVGAGRRIGKQHLMHKVGVGLLDRETGLLRSFAEGREESIAVTSIGPDGGYYLANSPVRRAIVRGLLGDRVPPIVGGIQRYRPVHLDLLVRDAACAAAARARNAQGNGPDRADATRDDLAQIATLLRQITVALPQAVQRGDLPAPVRDAVAADLDRAQSRFSPDALGELAAALTMACDRFP